MSNLLNQSVSITKSEAAERLISLNGRQLSFHNYPFIRNIYDGNHRTVLLKTGRQVSKSTTLANLMLVESSLLSYFRTMFVSPTDAQTSYFSNSRFSTSLDDSTVLRKFLLSGPRIKNNVYVKNFANGSSVIFRYASDNPDRARGFTADHLCYDEIQDMHPSIFDIINECTAMSEYGYKTFAGTPKSMENIMEIFWQESSQSEWVIKCDGCNHYNIPNMKNIFPKGMLCKKCEKKLNVRKGQWINFSESKAIQGFHIPQIILPWHVEKDERWADIIYKKEHLPESTFMNEVMGVSDAAGVRWLSLQDLKDCCIGFDMNVHAKKRKNLRDMNAYLRELGYVAVFAGIDWSGGGKGVRMSDGTMRLLSRNAITIMGIRSNNLADIIAHEIFAPEVTQPDVIKRIIDLCSKYHVTMVGADAGEGNLGNALLRESLGYHKVLPFRYSGNLAANVKYNKNSECHVLNKTKIIDTVMMAFKRKLIRFSKYDECEEIFTDIMAEYEETSGAQGGGNKIWTHSPRNPDDSLHAIVFAYCAYKAVTGQLGSEYYPTDAADSQII